jgi:hypothetical protein
VRTDEFAALMALLGAAYPSIERKEPTVALWWDELQGASFAAGEQAARACAHRCRFYPSLAEYLEELRHAQVRLRFAQPPELGYAASDPPASAEVAAGWLHEIRTFLAGIHAPRNLAELNEYRARGGLPPIVPRPLLTSRNGVPVSQLRPCTAPDCGKLTSRRDGLCVMHRPNHERREPPLPGTRP